MIKPLQRDAAAVNSYREEMDILGAFIDERCVLHPNAKAQATPLYREYCDWCQESGEHPASQAAFGAALGERGFVSKKKSLKFWLGIGIRDTRDTLDPSRSSNQSRARDTGKPEMGSEPSLVSQASQNWEEF